MRVQFFMPHFSLGTLHTCFSHRAFSSGAPELPWCHVRERKAAMQSETKKLSLWQESNVGYEIKHYETGVYPNELPSHSGCTALFPLGYS